MPLRLAASIARGPPDNAVAGADQMIEPLDEPVRAQQGECPDVGARQFRPQPRCRSEKRSALCYHIVDENEPADRQCQRSN